MLFFITISLYLQFDIFLSISNVNGLIKFCYVCIFDIMSYKLAFIFPGQGSQFIGMGKDLYDTYPQAREVFHEVDEVLNEKFSEMIFSGETDELTKTSNAQPAIMTVSIAAFRVICSQVGKENISSWCNVVAGHSLGEYTALCVANAFSLMETTLLLRARGNAMQRAIADNVHGGMLALIGTTFQEASKLVDAVQKIMSTEKICDSVCQIANDNGAGQFVLSGDMASIDCAASIAGDFAVSRAIKLKVNGPFHSVLMQKAADEMGEVLSNIKINIPTIPVVQNYTAKITSNPEEIRQSLLKQITGRVRWSEIIETISKDTDLIIELGPAQVLSKLAKRSLENRHVVISNFGMVSELDECVKLILRD